MKAIILAAGEGTRLKPLTNETPKAMVEIQGKTLLEHNMEKLLPYVNEFIIVVKYKKEAITEHFGAEYKGVPVRYHEQCDIKGTGAAVKGIQVKGDIIIAYADAIISQEDVDTVMSQNEYSVLVKEVDNPEKYGIFRADENGYAKEVIEKPQEYIGNLANFSFFKVNEQLIHLVDEIELSQRGELEITDAINLFVQKEKLKLIHLKHDIIDITSLEDVKKYNAPATAMNYTRPELGKTLFLEAIGDFELHLGIPKSEISEIVRYSLDESDTALQEGTGDKKRFASIEKLSSWYHDNGRFTFSLLSKEGKVGGIWWGRPAKAPNICEVIDEKAFQEIQTHHAYTHTSGIRIYPFARGKKLATPLLITCSKYYRNIFPQVHMCIDIDVENIPSQKAYERMGYTLVGYGENVKTVEANEKSRMVYVELPQ